MKFLLTLSLSVFSLVSPAHANDLSLFDFAVYAKNNIEAECSDFMGRTGAGGSVYLRDFLIQISPNELGCALESNSSVQMRRGKIAFGSDVSCLAAQSFRNYDGDAGTLYSPSAPFLSLNQEMDSLSNQLASRISNPNVKQVTLDMNRVRSERTIQLSGSANQLLVLNIFESNVSFKNIGIHLNGSLLPKNIIWNFPNATTLEISHAGVDPYGLPGTFLAPKAQVIFNNARITGALFADSILGRADQMDCQGVVSGQVNGACLNAVIPGVGCGSTGNGGQHQHPHQHQQPKKWF